jgi:DNA-binding response OmpR family regulator
MLNDSEIFARSDLIVAKNFLNALNIILNEEIDLVFINLNLPDSKDTLSIEILKAVRPDTPVIVLCNEINRYNGLKGYLKGAQNYFTLTEESNVGSLTFIMKAALNQTSIHSLNSLRLEFSKFLQVNNTSFNSPQIANTNN